MLVVYVVRTLVPAFDWTPARDGDRSATWICCCRTICAIWNEHVRFAFESKAHAEVTNAVQVNSACEIVYAPLFVHRRRDAAAYRLQQ